MTVNEPCWIRLTVCDAEVGDLAKGIARISENAMKILCTLDGDTIEIVGNKRTVAKAYSANLENGDGNIIKIDAYVRRNAGTKIGETVTVRKTSLSQAETVTIALSGLRMIVDEDLKNFLRKELFNRPLMKNSIVVVKMLAQLVPFIVVDTKPDGPVAIAESTELRIY
ncbi:hypothetical protein KEJ33_05940 [Candidatus Bathyarchaeota archaeon]|nr:hypothetical protein [Candidatus Bathyarchaeota archaeon]